jgi:hypothetical protein
MTPSGPGRPPCRAVAVALGVAIVGGLLAVTAWSPAVGGRLVVEDGAIEWIQVVLLAAAGLLAGREAWQRGRAGEPVAMEVAVAAAMAALVIGEIDLDRLFFGTKIISTRFFVHPRHPLALRLLAVVVVVGVPLALGLWLLRRWRELWRSALAMLRDPCGQVAAAGAALFLLVQVFEGPLDRLPGLPPNLAEEALELVAAVWIALALTVRSQVSLLRCPPAP